jgi:hypothetical protein
LVVEGILKPHVAQVLVCGPRKNTLGKVAKKNDRNEQIVQPGSTGSFFKRSRANYRAGHE